MQDLLLWLYGKSARNAHIRAMAEKLINILKKEGSMEYQRLAKELGIDFTKYQKPKRTFYFVVNPLKKVQLVKEKRVYTSKDRKKYETHYFLDPGAFKGYMTRVIEEFHAAVQSQK
ncbi:MAG: hypothetical protein QXD43_00995 [Candidatus Aenigmatarchaeota archaeon]